MPEQKAKPEGAFKKGDVIGGKYEVHRMLGKGGFGEVYSAYSRETHQVYALKTFRQEFLANAQVREDFKREALLWVNLEEHPFILAARWVEELSGRLFVAMDFIASDDQKRVSLDDHLRYSRGPLDADRALEWAIQFCYGMEHANAHGIKCHRDIKPANILIRQDGTLLISDFGLAAATEAAWRRRGGSEALEGKGGRFGLTLLHTEGKSICGTPGYIAPEVFRGEGADVRSDIYSFGLVLWQMATGSVVPPFHVASARDIGEYVQGVYERQLTERVPPVGAPLQAVIERCLAREPSTRYADFTEVRAELEPIFRQRTGRVVKLPPLGEGSAAFWSNKGMSLHALGRHDEAIACFKKALEIDPGDAITHTNLGVTLAVKGDVDGAIAAHSQAIRLQPDNAAAHGNLGGAFLAKGDLEGAVSACGVAVRLQPDLAEAHYGLGVALKRKHDLEGALAEYREAIRLRPDSAETHVSLAEALREKGQLHAAIEAYGAAIRIQPDNADLHNSLGSTLYDEGDLEGGIAAYRQAIRMRPDHAEAHFNLGNALRKKHDVESAVAEYRTAIRLRPDLADAHHNLGVLLVAKGDLESAIAAYRTAIRLRPDDAETHFNLGRALLLTLHFEEGIAQFHEAHRLDPSNPTIRQAYEMLCGH